MNNQLINFEIINEVVGDDADRIDEFCQAGMTSFAQFRDAYEESMLDRNMQQLRDEGHRVKPVAQMLGLNPLLEEYEKAKKILANGASDKKVIASVKDMQQICNQIIEEFRQRAGQEKS